MTRRYVRPNARPTTVIAAASLATLSLVVLSARPAGADWRPWQYHNGKGSANTWYTHAGSTSVRGGETDLLTSTAHAHIATYKASTGEVLHRADGLGNVQMWHIVRTSAKSKCKWTALYGGSMELDCWYFPP
jgi:hypothetical protein